MSMPYATLIVGMTAYFPGWTGLTMPVEWRRAHLAGDYAHASFPGGGVACGGRPQLRADGRAVREHSPRALP